MRKEVIYPIIFSAFMILGVTGCSGNQSSDVRTETQPNTIPNEPDQDLKGLLERNPTYNVIYNKLRQQNLGFVLFTMENLSEDMRVRFTRVDSSASEIDELDLQELLAPPGTDSIFVATSCTGRYRIDVAFLGRDYQNISVPDLYTRESSETFTLRPSSCSRPIRIIFPRIPQA